MSGRAARGRRLLAALGGLVALACGDVEVVNAPAEAPPVSGESSSTTGESGGGEPDVVDARPPPMAQPIPLWENGREGGMIDAATAREHGYIVLDLGEEWTPYLFTTRGNASEPETPNGYRDTYLALARGEFPRNHHGDRARSDKYLELYGIMPTLGLLRQRMRHTNGLACAAELDLEPLRSFEGFIAYENRDTGRNFARQVRYLENQIADIARAQNVSSPDQIDAARLSDRDARRFAEWQRTMPRYHAVAAAQRRLECEGYFEDKGEHVQGGLDWPTHEALAEFERRHRIYGWGFLGRETLEMLRRSPLEGDQEGVVRVLTERAMHAAGVIEDGSVGERQFRGEDGAQHDVPNLEGQVRTLVIEAFGLQTAEGTLAFLEQLGELPADQERLVAIRAPQLPEYYDGNMDLSVEIDRGDVWYEFPYDEMGQERGQPAERRPRLTIFTTYRGQRIPLARFGTTIGGWRSEQIEGSTWWRYKNSPPGPVIWHQIVAAPVWLPPESTPHRELLTRVPRGRGAEAYRVNYHEVGPSYASAYGLVAAYHIRYREDASGQLQFGPDEGIRTHGSVDYMSIMRRHSHGCHRLHNHMAVRLMSFVLAHRPHVRVGQQAIGFRRDLEHEGHTYQMALDQGGYVFQLAQPIHVEVLEGRIRGDRALPIEHPLPRWSSDVGAYMLPDGGAVAISRGGGMTAIPVPQRDGGVMMATPGLDGGVRPPTPPLAPAIPTATNPLLPH